jgi:hypothetical protein
MGSDNNNLIFSDKNIVPLDNDNELSLGYSGDSAENTYLWNYIYAKNISVSGTVTALKFNATSDYRIKENIKSLDNDFKVEYLNPISYINKQTNKPDIGLIAHELQEYYPELVTGVKDGHDLQSVNYIGLIPILINEIKLLKNDIKFLKEEIKNIKQ